MTILYIETNFLMSIAEGQDPQADLLLFNPPPSIQIYIPNICYIESMAVFKQKKQAITNFTKIMNERRREARRDLSSNHAQSLAVNLDQAIIDNNYLLNDLDTRLSSAIDRQQAKSKCIYLENHILQDTCSAILTQPGQMLVNNDLMDNLILRTIIHHATLPTSPRQEKAFISNNTKDFDKPEVKYALRNAGIRYFTMTQHFLDWFNSRSLT
ncbi:hypothetical protein H6F39_11980 [Anabaena sp. FACHB-1250]|uniref:PIN domain-containing protein n=1 Tax=Anabaena sp. FACHB-1250 TaxID=2692770 RepID=UPI001681A313|nr:PIN domain-containing protein [Anabaena sp. FACHB-1250]MBD2142057.1 hypothetical protein [Anabaena sp. FACHB-1250]